MRHIDHPHDAKCYGKADGGQEINRREAQRVQKQVEIFVKCHLCPNFVQDITGCICDQGRWVIVDGEEGSLMNRLLPLQI